MSDKINIAGVLHNKLLADCLMGPLMVHLKFTTQTGNLRYLTCACKFNRGYNAHHTS